MNRETFKKCARLAHSFRRMVLSVAIAFVATLCVDTQSALAGGNPDIVTSTGDLTNPCIPKFSPSAVTPGQPYAVITTAPYNNLSTSGCTNPPPSNGFGSGASAPNSLVVIISRSNNLDPYTSVFTPTTSSYSTNGFASPYAFYPNAVVTPPNADKYPAQFGNSVPTAITDDQANAAKTKSNFDAAMSGYNGGFSGGTPIPVFKVLGTP